MEYIISEEGIEKLAKMVFDHNPPSKEQWLEILQPAELVGFLPKYNEYGVGFKHAVVRNSLEAKMKDIIYNTDGFKIYIQKVNNK